VSSRSSLAAVSESQRRHHAHPIIWPALLIIRRRILATTPILVGSPPKIHCTSKGRLFFSNKLMAGQGVRNATCETTRSLMQHGKHLHTNTRLLSVLVNE
jgi:hypothetical protein